MSIITPEGVLEPDIDSLATHVLAIYKRLQGSEENAQLLVLLHDIVTFTKNHGLDGHALIAHPQITPVLVPLRRMSRQTESRQEKKMAQEVATVESLSIARLQSFVFYETYDALLTAEMKLLTDYLPTQPSYHFAFLGSGALPLSALLVAINHPQVRFDLVEHNGESAALSRRILTLLGLQDRFTVHERPAYGYDVSAHDAVWMASMLEDKEECIAAIGNAGKRKPPLIVRGVDGAAALMHTPLPLAVLAAAGYAEAARAPTLKNAVNTSHLYVAPDDMLKPDIASLAGNLAAIHKRLSDLKNPPDTEEKSLLFTRFHSIITFTNYHKLDASALLAHPLLAPVIVDLRHMARQTMNQQEKELGAKIAAMQTLNAPQLETFEHYGIYKAMTDAEMLLLGSFLPKQSTYRFAFLGSGAYPISALLVAINHPHVQFDLVEQDHENVMLSRQILHHLGLERRFTVHERRAYGYDVSAYDAVWIASMLEEKEECIAAIGNSQKRKPPLVLRGINGAAGLLHTALPLPIIATAGYSKTALTPVLKNVVSTSYLYTAKPS